MQKLRSPLLGTVSNEMRFSGDQAGNPGRPPAKLVFLLNHYYIPIVRPRSPMLSAYSQCERQSPVRVPGRLRVAVRPWAIEKAGAGIWRLRKWFGAGLKTTVSNRSSAEKTEHNRQQMPKRREKSFSIGDEGIKICTRVRANQRVQPLKNRSNSTAN